MKPGGTKPSLCLLFGLVILSLHGNYKGTRDLLLVATGTNSTTASSFYFKGGESQQIDGTIPRQLQVQEAHQLSQPQLHQFNKSVEGQVDAATQQSTLQGKEEATRLKSGIDPISQPSESNKTTQKLERQELTDETFKNVQTKSNRLRPNIAESQGNATKLTLPNSSDNGHFSNVAFLDLQPWENASMKSMDGFPGNIPEFCAIGTISVSGVLKQHPTCKKSDYDFVQRHLRQEIPEDGICDVCRIMDLAKKGQNLTLALLGDSVSLQSFGGLVCELARRNYDVNVTEHRNMRTADCSGGWVCLRDRFTVQILDPSNTDGGAVTIYYFGQYMFDQKPQGRFYETTLQHVLAVKADVLIFNFGLHYRWSNPQIFQNAMHVLLDAFQEHLSGKIPLIMYRENTPQHFKAPYGEYGLRRVGQRGDPPGQCGPLGPRGGDLPYHWRDDRLRRWAVAKGFRIAQVDLAHGEVEGIASAHNHDAVKRKASNELVWIPFTDFLAPLHTLHPRECTHYCHTPFLWYPIWRGIRLAMEQKFGDS